MKPEEHSNVIFDQAITAGALQKPHSLLERAMIIDYVL
jgi:hypothetical protein